jgi:hypothetical protein
MSDRCAHYVNLKYPHPGCTVGIYNGKLYIYTVHVVLDISDKYEDERCCIPPLNSSAKVLHARARPYTAINGKVLSKLSRF